MDLKKKTKKSREPFHDGLVPLLLLICVLPLITYLVVYDCGYSEYLWYGGDGLRTDVYSYVKSRFFMVAAVFCAGILVFRAVLYREKLRPWKGCIPLLGYAVMVCLSAVFSQNPTAAFSGNLDSFENALVLVGYAVVCVYAYQMMDTEKDYRIIWGGILAVLAVMGVQGILQIVNIDLLDMEWVQRLIMSEEAFAVYGGRAEHTFTYNTVYLSLYNPNYAGVYMTMMLSVTGVMALTEPERGRKVFYALSAVLSAVLMWFTYSRSTLVSTAVGCAVLAVCMGRKNHGRALKYLFAGAALVAAALVAADGAAGFPYLSGLIDEDAAEPLERMLTTDKGLELTYGGETWLFTIEEDHVSIRDKEGKVLVRAAEGEEAPLDFEDGAYIYPVQGDYGLEFWMYLAQISMEFVKTDDGYFYRTLGGKLDRMTKIDRVDFHGLEYLGSGRVYIWSRTLPLLKKYLLLGSGPDTFAESFPQNDYAGKVVYSNNPGRIVEKGHNDFLTKWVQTGMISVLFCAAFYMILVRRSFRAYAGLSEYRFSERLGLGCFIACVCYIAGSLFNDSTIQTAPLFWVCAGIALGAAEDVLSGRKAGSDIQ